MQGFPAVITGLLGAGGLYKLIEKLLDNRDKAAARESALDDQRVKADVERIRELENKILPLAEKAAAAAWLEKENERVEKENEALKRELKESEIERIQAQTVANGYKVFADLFADDEGRAFLKARFDALRERGE